MTDNSPIGIFDSGMGGLTVFRAVAEKLPNESLIYFGDTAHVPYGNKSRDTVTKYSRAIADFLKEKNIKLMVVACNTASVYALEDLKKRMDFPVIGVVEAGVKAALNTAKNSIGIIGTYGTIKSKEYENMIRENNSNIEILSRACPLFVPLVEEGWTDHPVTESVADIYLREFRGKTDSIILACTHYPLLKDVISRVVDHNVTIIDSAVEVAKEVGDKIKELDMCNDGSEIKNEFFVSDAPELFKQRGPIFLGHEIKEVNLAVR